MTEALKRKKRTSAVWRIKAERIRGTRTRTGKERKIGPSLEDEVEKRKSLKYLVILRDRLELDLSMVG